MTKQVREESGKEDREGRKVSMHLWYLISQKGGRFAGDIRNPRKPGSQVSALRGAAEICEH